MSGKKSRSMIFSIAATYVSSSRTVEEARFLGFLGVDVDVDVDVDVIKELEDPIF